MAEEPEQPRPAERLPQQPGQALKEHFGPLELLRTSKADGRALLLFSRRPGEHGARSDEEPS